jgi:hypothetical protein
MSSRDRPGVVGPPSRQRSAITNGRRLFADGDGRSPWSRRLRDLIELHAADLGGADILSEAQASLIRRAAVIEVELERMEGRLSAGEVVDLDQYTRAVGHLRRVLETLGIERTKRDVTPTLSEYLASKATKKSKHTGGGRPTAARRTTRNAPIIDAVVNGSDVTEVKQ